MTDRPEIFMHRAALVAITRVKGFSTLNRHAGNMGIMP